MDGTGEEQDEPRRALTAAERQRNRRARLRGEQAQVARQAEVSARISASAAGRPATAGSFTPGRSYADVAGRAPNLQHGGRSQKMIGALAEVKAAALLTDAATPQYLRQAAYAATVTAWSRAEAVAELLWDWLCEHDIAAALTEIAREEENVTARGPKVRRVTVSKRTGAVLDQFQKANSRANDLRKELGLTPLSRARLGKDVADQQVGLARIWAQMDEQDRKKAMAGEVPKELPSADPPEGGGEHPPATGTPAPG
jgi:hypothetical protein